jgi:acyl carrier protein
LHLQLDKALIGWLRNSIKRVAGRRKQDFCLKIVFTGNQFTSTFVFQKKLLKVVKRTIYSTMEKHMIDLISSNLRIPSAQINLYSDLDDDLHLDTIDKVLLIADLEAQFGVFLSPEEAASIQTVQDVCHYFIQRCAA